MDTVPPSSSTQLNLNISKDKAHGLGTKDMKGGIISSLLSLEKISDLTKIGLIFYGDEEYTQKGIHSLVSDLPKIITRKPKLIISPESRFNLGYGARGIIVLDLKIIGKKAHSARPHEGNDAVKGTFFIIEALEKKYVKHTSLGQTSFTITKIKGGSLSYSGRVENRHGTVPDYAKATISVRNSRTNLTGQQLSSLIHKIGASRNLKITTRIISDYPASIASQNLVKSISQVVYKTLSYKLELGDPKLAGYNDAAILAKALNCPVINFGPYGEGNHTVQEWVSLSSIEKASEILAEIVNSI